MIESAPLTNLLTQIETICFQRGLPKWEQMADVATGRVLIKDRFPAELSSMWPIPEADPNNIFYGVTIRRAWSEPRVHTHAGTLATVMLLRTEQFPVGNGPTERTLPGGVVRYGYENNRSRSSSLNYRLSRTDNLAIVRFSMITDTNHPIPEDAPALATEDPVHEPEIMALAGLITQHTHYDR